ncbi:MAG: efflux RND transporter periplasmic adaptor subunit [Kangiellaceae bacterium]|nr:efflux RND transporter periplasmic adaptor subunit [Kangiellaceae bacterium]
MLSLRYLLALSLLAIAFNINAADGASVIVAPVEQKDFVDEVEALGTLRANESVSLTSIVTERVVKVHFNDGQRVKRGDVLVEMDDSEEQALLEEEQSRLKEANLQVKRLEPLAARSATTQADLDVQRREVETAMARMQAIRSRIQERKILAPFDGVLGLRNISVGAITQPGNVITTIDDDSVMKLDFSIPAVYLSEITPGLSIDASSRAYSDQMFGGKVSSVDSRIDPVTRSVVVRALIDNKSKKLKPGLLMRVSLAANPRQALIIPEEALIPMANLFHVMVVEKTANGYTARKQQVTIGARRKGEVEVLTGLSTSDKVITHGSDKVVPGKPITIRATENNNESLSKLLEQPAKAKD